MIRLLQHNETHLKVQCSDLHIEEEMSEHFTYFAQNYQHTPKFKSGLWDGTIKLFSLRYKTIYKGLLHEIVKYAELHAIPIEIDPKLNFDGEYSEEQAKEWLEKLELPEQIEVRGYQYTAVAHALAHKRSILEAATAAGKSLMFYACIRKHIEEGRRVLLIVTSVGLVKQMFSDFQDYSSKNGWDVEANAHTIFAGQERVFDKPLIISTWQTLSSMIKSDEKKFLELTKITNVLYADEAHEQKTVETSKVIEAFKTTAWRTGMTGTLDGISLHEMTLKGLLGPSVKIVSARELIDGGHATNVEIRIMRLKHPEIYRKALKGMKYTEEVNHIVSNKARNTFIARLACACTGNTMIIFNLIAKHGDLIHEELKKYVKPGRNIYYLKGSVKANDREKIRKILETETDAIVLAVSKLVSTGTNIPSLHNMINTLPGKSTIRIRQSIGRNIRLSEGKILAKYFDIADDYSIKSWKNTAMKHLDERIAIYAKENFDMKVTDVELKY